MTSPAVGIVTGANRGIGYAIVRRLVSAWPASFLHKTVSSAVGGAQVPLLLYLTARNEAFGKNALTTLLSEEAVVKSASLDQGLVDVRFHPLDVENSQSVDGLAAFVAKEHPSGIDFLVNNAGIAPKGFDLDVVDATLACNYYGLVGTTRALLPHLKPTSRIVNMGSALGMLSRYSVDIAARFRGARTEEEVTALMREFTTAVKEDRLDVSGFPKDRAYAVSKAAVIGFTRALAAELAQDETRADTLVNVCCPGWVRTRLTLWKGVKKPDQGSRTPIQLVLGDIDGRSGGYWKGTEEQEW